MNAGMNAGLNGYPPVQPLTSPTLVLLALAALAGCASAPVPVEQPMAAAVPDRDYPGEMDLWLVPYDDHDACSVTVGLRNASGVRQGEAWLTLRWRGAEGGELDAASRIRMDPLLAGRYNAKNETLPLRCADLVEVEVTSAEWTLLAGWNAPTQPVVPIQEVSGTRWRFSWSDEHQAWRGERLAP